MKGNNLEESKRMMHVESSVPKDSPRPDHESKLMQNLTKIFANKAQEAVQNIKSRRARYFYQNQDDGQINPSITLFYCIPAFSRNPLLLLIR